MSLNRYTMKDNMLGITLVIGTFVITLLLAAIINLIAGIYLITHANETICTIPVVTKGATWAASSQSCEDKK